MCENKKIVDNVMLAIGHCVVLSGTQKLQNNNNNNNVMTRKTDSISVSKISHKT